MKQKKIVVLNQIYYLNIVNMLYYLVF